VAELFLGRDASGKQLGESQWQIVPTSWIYCTAQKVLLEKRRVANILLLILSLLLFITD